MYIRRIPTFALLLVAGACGAPSTDPTDESIDEARRRRPRRCDAGPLLCDSLAPACEQGTIAAVQNGCWACVDPTTCQPPFPICPPADQWCTNGQGGLCCSVTPYDPPICFVCAPTQCGGFAGLTCNSKAEVCIFPDGTCQNADEIGTCTTRGDVCPLNFAPVCGCDGVTYGNRCEATVNGASIAHEGRCRVSTTSADGT